MPADFLAEPNTHLLGGDDPDGSPEDQPSVATDVSLDRLWHVIVWNDPVNLMSYVVYVLQKLFGYNLDKATQLMLEVHNDGKSVVATVERERGEGYVSRLHSYGLQATLQQEI